MDAAWAYLEQAKCLDGAEEAVYEIKARRSDASVSGEQLLFVSASGGARLAGPGPFSSPEGRWVRCWQLHAHRIAAGHDDGKAGVHD